MTRRETLQAVLVLVAGVLVTAAIAAFGPNLWH